MDISTPTMTYHQVFMYGSPSAQAMERPRNDETQRISFCFTLPVEAFGPAPLKMARAKRVVSLWKEKDFMRALPDQKHLLKLHFQWRRQAEDYFSLRIMPETESAQVPPIDPSIHRPQRQAPPKVISVGQ